MDPGFPKGGIERVFAQYDRITSHRPPEHEMQAEPKAKEPEATEMHVLGDEPPWHSPEDMPVPAAAPPPDPFNGASGGFGKLVGSGMAIRAIGAELSQGRTARIGGASVGRGRGSGG